MAMDHCPLNKGKGLSGGKTILSSWTPIKAWHMLIYKMGLIVYWEDLWNNHVPKHHFPELYSFAKDTSISLKNAREAVDPATLLHLPISQIALQQLNELAQLLESLPNTAKSDSWSYIWGNHFFSASKAYTHLTGHRHTHPAFKWLWKLACQNKHKVFFFGFGCKID